MGVAVEFPKYERAAEGGLQWELDHCAICIDALQSLGENGHGVSDLGVDVIVERLNYWLERQFELARKKYAN